MNNCEYTFVENGDDNKRPYYEDHKRRWKPLLRQLMISSCVWILYFQYGLCLGAPTVLLPRMREQRGEDYVTTDMASWISSAMMGASLPWVPVVAWLTSTIGRRFTFAAGVATSIAGFAVLSVGDTPIQVLAGMIVQGPLPAQSMTITLLVLTEYTSPLYRGVFLTIKSASLYWGVWVANVIGTVSHWHYIAWLGMGCGVYNAVVLFAWPESPYWLASKGRLEQCREAHRWLKGHSPSSEKELAELIKGQQQDCDESELNSNMRRKTFGEKCREISRKIKSKCFYKSLLIGVALIGLYTFLGKMVLSVYAIDIIKDMTKSKDEAYKTMLILDGVTILGMHLGCALSKKLKRKTLLFYAGGGAVLFLLAISIYLFLMRIEVISENTYIAVVLLTCYCLSVSCGPIILNSTLQAEVLPLRLRGTAATILAMVSNLASAGNLKVAPFIFNSFGIDGAFLLYGLCSGGFLVYLIIILPETKDKTLEEIQDLILGCKTDDAFECTEMKKFNCEIITVK